MAVPAFAYQPISESETRFIRTAKGDWDDPIRCELVVYSQARDRPEYVALSYTWGYPKDTVTIFVNEQPLLVGRNLFMALRQFRDFLSNPYNAPKAFRSGDILLWADALCINQADLDEKSEQVPRMRDIYSQANLVFAWLGENVANDGAVGEVMRMANMMKASTTSDGSHTAVIHEYLVNYEPDTFVTAFKELLERPWFFRIWVIQEVALARDDPIFVSGMHWCTVDELWRLWCVVTSLEDYGWKTRSLRWGYRLSVYGECRILMNPTDYPLERKEQTEDIYPLIRWANFDERCYIAVRLSMILNAMPQNLSATIPHDYLYGILSMADAAGYPISLRPDYRKTFSQVFHDYCRLIIEETCNLWIIPRRHHRLNDVPSWVPDFRWDATDSPNNHRSLDFSMSSYRSISADGEKLKVEGLHLGEVIATHFSVRHPENIDTLIQDLHLFDIFLKLCATKRTPDQEKASFGPIIHEQLDIWFSNTEKAVPISVVRDLYHSIVDSRKFDPRRKLSEQEEFIFRRLEEKLCGWSFFLTSTGTSGRLETCDVGVEKGDVVVILMGAKSPFLLRPSAVAGEYTFLGNSVVLGELGRAYFDEEFFAKKALQKFTLV